MPHRKHLLELLQSYVPKSALEEHAKTAIVEFVVAAPDCFLRSNLAGHITASCWLMDETLTEVLLTHHKKIGLWLQLGGHADGETNVIKAALKEAEEESGIIGITLLNDGIFDVEVHKIEEHQGVPAHFHYDVRFLMKAPHKNFVVSDESHSLKWVNIKELAKDSAMNESLKRMAQKKLDPLKDPVMA